MSMAEVAEWQKALAEADLQVTAADQAEWLQMTEQTGVQAGWPGEEQLAVDPGMVEQVQWQQQQQQPQCTGGKGKGFFLGKPPPPRITPSGGAATCTPYGAGAKAANRLRPAPGSSAAAGKGALDGLPPGPRATGATLPPEGIPHTLPGEFALSLPTEVSEYLKETFTKHSGTVRFPCEYGRQCRMPTCEKTHVHGREIEDHPDTLICKHTRRCKRKDCFYVHIFGREIDEHPELAICKLGRACKKWGCCFEHPDGRELDEKGWCAVCGEEGHTKWECTKVPCKNCLQPGHRPHNCPRLECRVCGEEGHRRADCPNVGNKNHRPLCRTCGERGHVGAECDSVQCSKCGEFGHRLVDCQNPGGIVSTEEDGMFEDMQTFAVHIDELDMPRRTEIEPKEADVEVWVDPLPDDEDLPAWVAAYGDTQEVFRLPDPATGEPWDRGYVRFKSHESACKCVEAGAGSWSESERALKSQRIAEWKGAYPYSLVGIFVGKCGVALTSVREEMGARRLLLRGQGLAPEFATYQVSTRLHFICVGSTDAIEKMRPLLEKRLAETHMELDERIRSEKAYANKQRKRTRGYGGYGGYEGDARGGEARGGEEQQAQGLAADADERAAKRPRGEVGEEGEAWFAALPDELQPAELDMRQALLESIRKIGGFGDPGMFYKFSKVTQDKRVQEAKKALGLPQDVNLTNWVQRRLRHDFDLFRDEGGDSKLRFLHGGAQDSRPIPPPPPLQGGDKLAHALIAGLAHLDPVHRGLQGVRLSLVSALDPVKEAKKELNMPKSFKLAHWIAQFHADKLSVRRDSHAKEDCLFLNTAPGMWAPPPPPPSGPPPPGPPQWPMHQPHRPRPPHPVYGGHPPPPGPPSPYMARPSGKAEAANFLDNLPDDRLLDEELELRACVIKLLSEKGGHCLLAELCRDKELQNVKGNVLPRGVLLRDWIEMRIGEEVILEQGENRAFTATLAEGVELPDDSLDEVPEDEVAVSDCEEG